MSTERKSRCRSSVVLVLGLALLVSRAASATTVSDFSVEDLTRFADFGVRATVLTRAVDDAGQTSYVLSISDVLFGSGPAGDLRLSLDHTIEGMPDMKPGEELVLFVNPNNRYEKVIGLRWGTYRVLNEKIHDFKGRALTVNGEVRGGKPLSFVRPAGDEAAAVSYTGFRQVVKDVRLQVERELGRSDQGRKRLERR